jgi:hypothetical protein
MRMSFAVAAHFGASADTVRKSPSGVRREKGGAFQWVQAHPATASAGSNQSGLLQCMSQHLAHNGNAGSHGDEPLTTSKWTLEN